MTHAQEQPVAVPAVNSGSAEAAAFQDEQVKKRMAIGLSAQRPTAKSAPQRPPERQSSQRLQFWTLVGIISALLVATLLLVFAKVANSPTSWPWVVRNLTGGVMSPKYADSDLNGYLLMAGSNFDEAGSILAAEERPGAYVMGQVADTGVYRMRIWPDNMAWSVLTTACPSPVQHIEASALVAADAPSGYAGMAGRYRNGSNFYLFHVDGAGAFEVLLMKDGAWQTVQARQLHPAINQAGTANQLGLLDDGEQLVFTANGQVLHQIDSPGLPSGSVGLAGRAVAAPTEVNFDSFRLYGLPCSGVE